jgi:hypothetical protein
MLMKYPITPAHSGRMRSDTGVPMVTSAWPLSWYSRTCIVASRTV